MTNMSDESGNLLINLVVQLPADQSNPTLAMGGQTIERELSYLSFGGVDRLTAKQLIAYCRTINPGLTFKARWVGTVDLA